MCLEVGETGSGGSHNRYCSGYLKSCTASTSKWYLLDQMTFEKKGEVKERVDGKGEQFRAWNRTCYINCANYLTAISSAVIQSKRAKRLLPYLHVIRFTLKEWTPMWFSRNPIILSDDYNIPYFPRHNCSFRPLFNITTITVQYNYLDRSPGVTSHTCLLR